MILLALGLDPHGLSLAFNFVILVTVTPVLSIRAEGLLADLTVTETIDANNVVHLSRGLDEQNLFLPEVLIY